MLTIRNSKQLLGNGDLSDLVRIDSWCRENARLRQLFRFSKFLDCGYNLVVIALQ